MFQRCENNSSGLGTIGQAGGWRGRSFPSFFGQRFDGLLADLAEPRIDDGIVHIGNSITTRVGVERGSFG